MITGILFQEELHKDPFWMLVACCLVNRTTWRSAESVFEEIRRKWPTPASLALASTEELEPLLRPLGLFRRRAKNLIYMAESYDRVKPTYWRDVLDIPGCGQYAADSWAIFVDGLRSVVPNDKELKIWLENNK